MWELRAALALVAVSLMLYIGHFAWFRDLRHIWLWSFTSLAFLPISVLVVTLLINRLLSARDTALRMDKLNMLIGTFFSSVGTDLLVHFSDWDADEQYLRNHFGAPDSWSSLDTRAIHEIVSRHPFSITVSRESLEELRVLLIKKTDFLMRLLENPHLLEQEDFSELLRAVFHLAEELTCRPEILSTPDSDLRHLTGDVERAYALLVREWAVYLRYVRLSYPYLFSLAVRTNPFDRTASPIIGER
jgi:hypothetical protein